MLKLLEKQVCFYSNKELSSYTKDMYFKNNTIEFGFEVPYYIKDVMIDKEIFRKIFVIDIRDISEKQIKNIFDYFSFFQIMIFSKYYYQDFAKDKFNYRFNMEVIFLYNVDKHYDIDKYSVLYDMNFVFKRFMTEDELKSYLENNYANARFNKFDVIRMQNKDYFYMRKFNYVHGSNGSGKTVLLNKLSNKLEVPIFSMDNFSLSLMDYIEDKDYLRKYLYMLTGSYEFGNYSDYEKYINRLCQILEYSREQKNILLLDDIRWNSLDSRNKIQLIDTLFEHSVVSEGVVFTGCNSDQKRLVKTRVYRPNIIDL